MVLVKGVGVQGVGGQGVVGSRVGMVGLHMKQYYHPHPLDPGNPPKPLIF